MCSEVSFYANNKCHSCGINQAVLKMQQPACTPCSELLQKDKITDFSKQVAKKACGAKNVDHYLITGEVKWTKSDQKNQIADFTWLIIVAVVILILICWCTTAFGIISMAFVYKMC